MPPPMRRSGAPRSEAQALRAAIEAARSGLAALAACADRRSGRHARFQLAMLDDASLSEPAFAAIDAGAQADTAWSELGRRDRRLRGSG